MSVSFFCRCLLVLGVLSPVVAAQTQLENFVLRDLPTYRGMVGQGVPGFAGAPPVPIEGNFGRSSCIADLNADGIPDLIVGAPTLPTDPSQQLSGLDDAGHVFIYFGTPDLGSPGETTELTASLAGSGSNADVTSTEGFPLYGGLIIDGEKLTYSGKTKTQFQNLRRGTHGTFPVSHDAGVSILGFPTFDPSNINPGEGVDLVGLPGELLGYSVALAGDVDGDGKQDVIVGAPGNSVVRNGAGGAYILFGHEGWETVSVNPSSGEFHVVQLYPVAMGTSEKALFIQGAREYSSVGYSVSGDVFYNDQFPSLENPLESDVVLGAPLDSTNNHQQNGTATVLFGDPAWKTHAAGEFLDLDLLSAGEGTVVHGSTDFQLVGHSVAGLGNFDRLYCMRIASDAPAPPLTFHYQCAVSESLGEDVAIGAPGTTHTPDGGSPELFAGAAYVLRGAPFGDHSIPAIPELNFETSQFGHSSFDPFPTNELPPVPDIRTPGDVWYGKNAGDQAGFFVGRGGQLLPKFADLDPVSGGLLGEVSVMEDLIVTAPFNDGVGKQQCGSAYVVGGSTDIHPYFAYPLGIDLGTIGQGWLGAAVQGAQTGDGLEGVIAIGAGRWSYDSNAELLVSFPNATTVVDGVAHPSAGRTYLIDGLAAFDYNQFHETVNLADPPEDLVLFTFDGSETNALSGVSLAVADFNFDSFPDLSIGSPGAPSSPNWQDPTGIAHLKTGRSDLVYGPIFRIEAVTPRESFHGGPPVMITGPHLEGELYPDPDDAENAIQVELTGAGWGATHKKVGEPVDYHNPSSPEAIANEVFPLGEIVTGAEGSIALHLPRIDRWNADPLHPNVSSDITGYPKDNIIDVRVKSDNSQPSNDVFNLVNWIKYTQLEVTSWPTSGYAGLEVTFTGKAFSNAVDLGGNLDTTVQFDGWYDAGGTWNPGNFGTVTSIASDGTSMTVILPTINPGHAGSPVSISINNSNNLRQESGTTSLVGSLGVGEENTVNVLSTEGFPDFGKLEIGDERIYYSSKTSTSFDTLVRGVGLSDAAAHAHGASVTGVYVTERPIILEDAITFFPVVVLDVSPDSGPQESGIEDLTKFPDYTGVPAVPIDITVGLSNGSLTQNTVVEFGTDEFGWHEASVLAVTGNQIQVELPHFLFGPIDQMVGIRITVELNPGQFATGTTTDAFKYLASDFTETHTFFDGTETKSYDHAAFGEAPSIIMSGEAKNGGEILIDMDWDPTTYLAILFVNITKPSIPPPFKGGYFALTLDGLLNSVWFPFGFGWNGLNLSADLPHAPPAYPPGIEIYFQLISVEQSGGQKAYGFSNVLTMTLDS